MFDVRLRSILNISLKHLFLNLFVSLRERQRKRRFVRNNEYHLSAAKREKERKRERYGVGEKAVPVEDEESSGRGILHIYIYIYKPGSRVQ
tara:strand:- start:657 stop:929 length:273 start_codon:yes stop_codon:yes gene_type:complete